MNVNWNLSAVTKLPELNEADFIVCEAESLFVQVTVVPAFIVRDAGLNAKFWIVTLLLAGCVWLCSGWLAGAGFGAETLFWLPELQPPRNKTLPKIIGKISFLFILLN